jgi:hypothetical protein
MMLFLTRSLHPQISLYLSSYPDGCENFLKFDRLLIATFVTTSTPQFDAFRSACSFVTSSSNRIKPRYIEFQMWVMVRIVDMNGKITRYAVRRDVGHVILMIRLYQNES